MSALINFELINCLCEDDIFPYQFVEALTVGFMAKGLNTRLLKKKKQKRERSNHFYRFTIPQYDLDEFQKHFLMSRAKFEELLQAIAARALSIEEPIANVPLEKKLLFVVWILATQESYLAVGDRFDISKSSGHTIFMYIVYILSGFSRTYIKWPDSASRAITTNIFKYKSRGIPGVVGAIDCCHIRIKQPVRNAFKYLNKRKEHSIILQAVCDQNGRFIDIYVGKPGKMNNAQVYRSSVLHSQITKNLKNIFDIKTHLIGSSEYPLNMHLLTPYKKNLSVSHIKFNQRLFSIKSVIDRAFALLKEKFQRLQYLDIKNPVVANHIIMACCVLYNFTLDNENVSDGILKLFMMSESLYDDEDCPLEAKERREYITSLLN